MKKCSACNNIIQDNAIYCPKCGASVQNSSTNSQSSANSSPSVVPSSGQSIPPPPPCRSTTGSVYSQQAISGSDGKNDSYGYQEKSSQKKSKNDNSTGKTLLKLFIVAIGILGIVIVLGIYSSSSSTDKTNNGNQPQAEAAMPSDSNGYNPNSESDSSYNPTQEQIMALQEEESRKAAEEESLRLAEEEALKLAEEESRRSAELELANAKKEAAEAERALIEERRKAADEISAQKLSMGRASIACPYNKANPLLCESRGRRQVSCAWDYAACGEPSIHKTLSKTSCTNKAKTDRQNNQIIITDGCRAQIVPQDN